MNRDWIENLEKHLPSSNEHAIHDFALQINLSHWHPISTAPCNRELELRISEQEKISTLEFPCLQTSLDEWIDVDLGTRIKLQPVEWRVWQHSKSPQPHYSPATPNDRIALLHHTLWSAKRQTSIDTNDFVMQKTDVAN